jgi:rhodanese-related sulfurtransferase
MKPCGTCKEKPIIKDEIYPVHQEKLDAVVKKYLPKDIFPYFHFNSQTFHLEGLIPNQYIFYFGAYPRDAMLPLLKKDAAYRNLGNSGIARTDENGKTIVYMDCPQIYIFDDGKVYPRHFHFVYWKPQQKKWDNNLFTHPIFCIVHQKFIQTHQQFKLVNALSKESYRGGHIVGCYNLPQDEKWGIQDVKKILNIEDKNYPIIVYCWDEKCQAAKKVLQRLEKLGFNNLFYYNKGLKNWRGNIIQE